MVSFTQHSLKPTPVCDHRFAAPCIYFAQVFLITFRRFKYGPQNCQSLQSLLLQSIIQSPRQLCHGNMVANKVNKYYPVCCGSSCVGSSLWLASALCKSSSEWVKSALEGRTWFHVPNQEVHRRAAFQTAFNNTKQLNQYLPCSHICLYHRTPRSLQTALSTASVPTTSSQLSQSMELSSCPESSRWQ